MAEAISSANADKALEAMGRMFNEARAGELNDYQRGRFEQLAIGFLGSGGEPETRQEWLERADGQFSLTRKRVEMVKQIAEKATRGNLSQDDQVGLARSLIVLRLFPEKLRQVAGDLMRDNPGKWQDVVTAISLSLTNPKAGEGFSQGDNQVFARAAERTLEFFTAVANEVVGQPAGPRTRAGEVIRRVEEEEERNRPRSRRAARIDVIRNDILPEDVRQTVDVLVTAAVNLGRLDWAPNDKEIKQIIGAVKVASARLLPEQYDRVVASFGIKLFGEIGVAFMAAQERGRGLTDEEKVKMRNYVTLFKKSFPMMEGVPPVKFFLLEIERRL